MTYINFWKNIINFVGRATRKEYWVPVIINFIVKAGIVAYMILCVLYAIGFAINQDWNVRIGEHLDRFERIVMEDYGLSDSIDRLSEDVSAAYFGNEEATSTGRRIAEILQEHPEEAEQFMDSLADRDIVYFIHLIGDDEIQTEWTEELSELILNNYGIPAVVIQFDNDFQQLFSGASYGELSEGSQCIMDMIGTEIVDSVNSVILWSRILMIWCIIIFVPSLAITVRRLNDAGLSGVLCLIGFIPIIGKLIMIVLMLLPSKREEVAGLLEDSENTYA